MSNLISSTSPGYAKLWNAISDALLEHAEEFPRFSTRNEVVGEVVDFLNTRIAELDAEEAEYRLRMADQS